MSNQNKILSLRKLDRVGQLADTNLNQLQSGGNLQLDSDGTISLAEPATPAVSADLHLIQGTQTQEQTRFLHSQIFTFG